METFDVELYRMPENIGGNHEMVYVPLFGTHELVSEVTIRLRRREPPL